MSEGNDYKTFFGHAMADGAATQKREPYPSCLTE